MEKKIVMIMLVLTALLCLWGCDDRNRILHKDFDVVMIYTGNESDGTKIFVPWDSRVMGDFYYADRNYIFGGLKPGDIVKMLINYRENSEGIRFFSDITKVHSAEVVTDSYMASPQEDIMRVNNDMVFQNDIMYGHGVCYYLLYEGTGDIVLIYFNQAELKYNIVINDIKEDTFQGKYHSRIYGYMYTYFADEELTGEELLSRIESKDESIFYLGKKESSE